MFSLLGPRGEDRASRISAFIKIAIIDPGVFLRQRLSQAKALRDQARAHLARLQASPKAVLTRERPVGM